MLHAVTANNYEMKEKLHHVLKLDRFQKGLTPAFCQMASRWQLLWFLKKSAGIETYVEIHTMCFICKDFPELFNDLIHKFEALQDEP